MKLLRVIYDRFCDWVKVCSRTDLLIALHKLLAIMLLFMHIFNAKLVHVNPTHIQNAIFVYISFWLIIYSDTILLWIYRKISSIHLDIPTLSEKTPKKPLSDRLWDFLNTYGGFPVQDAIREFGLSTREVKAVGDALEQEGILVRGDNNARVIKKTTLLHDGSYVVVDTDKAKLADILDKTVAKA